MEVVDDLVGDAVYAGIIALAIKGVARLIRSRQQAAAAALPLAAAQARQEHDRRHQEELDQLKRRVAQLEEHLEAQRAKRPRLTATAADQQLERPSPASSAEHAVLPADPTTPPAEPGKHLQHSGQAADHPADTPVNLNEDERTRGQAGPVLPPRSTRSARSGGGAGLHSPERQAQPTPAYSGSAEQGVVPSSAGGRSRSSRWQQMASPLQVAAGDWVGSHLDLEALNDMSGPQAQGNGLQWVSAAPLAQPITHFLDSQLEEMSFGSLAPCASMDFADAGEQNPAVGDPPATSMLNTAQLHDASPAPRPGQIQVETTSGQATSKPQPRPYLQGLMEVVGDEQVAAPGAGGARMQASHPADEAADHGHLAKPAGHAGHAAPTQHQPASTDAELVVDVSANASIAEHPHHQHFPEPAAMEEADQMQGTSAQHSAHSMGEQPQHQHFPEPAAAEEADPMQEDQDELALDQSDPPQQSEVPRQLRLNEGEGPVWNLTDTWPKLAWRPAVAAQPIPGNPRETQGLLHPEPAVPDEWWDWRPTGPTDSSHDDGQRDSRSEERGSSPCFRAASCSVSRRHSARSSKPGSYRSGSRSRSASPDASERSPCARSRSLSPASWHRSSRSLRSSSSRSQSPHGRDSRSDSGSPYGRAVDPRDPTDPGRLDHSSPSPSRSICSDCPPLSLRRRPSPVRDPRRWRQMLPISEDARTACPSPGGSFHSASRSASPAGRALSSSPSRPSSPAQRSGAAATHSMSRSPSPSFGRLTVGRRNILHSPGSGARHRQRRTLLRSATRSTSRDMSRSRSRSPPSPPIGQNASFGAHSPDASPLGISTFSPHRAASRELSRSPPASVQDTENVLDGSPDPMLLRRPTRGTFRQTSHSAPPATHRLLDVTALEGAQDDALPAVANAPQHMVSEPAAMGQCMVSEPGEVPHAEAAVDADVPYAMDAEPIEIQPSTARLPQTAAVLPLSSHAAAAGDSIGGQGTADHFADAPLPDVAHAAVDLGLLRQLTDLHTQEFTQVCDVSPLTTFGKLQCLDLGHPGISNGGQGTTAMRLAAAGVKRPREAAADAEEEQPGWWRKVARTLGGLLGIRGHLARQAGTNAAAMPSPAMTDIGLSGLLAMAASEPAEPAEPAASATMATAAATSADQEQDSQELQPAAVTTAPVDNGSPTQQAGAIEVPASSQDQPSFAAEGSPVPRPAASQGGSSGARDLGSPDVHISSNSSWSSDSDSDSGSTSRGGSDSGSGASSGSESGSLGTPSSSRTLATESSDSDTSSDSVSSKSSAEQSGSAASKGEDLITEVDGILCDDPACGPVMVSRQPTTAWSQIRDLVMDLPGARWQAAGDASMEADQPLDSNHVPVDHWQAAHADPLDASQPQGSANPVGAADLSSPGAELLVAECVDVTAGAQHAAPAAAAVSDDDTPGAEAAAAVVQPAVAALEFEHAQPDMEHLEAQLGSVDVRLASVQALQAQQELGDPSGGENALQQQLLGRSQQAQHGKRAQQAVPASRWQRDAGMPLTYTTTQLPAAIATIAAQARELLASAGVAEAPDSDSEGAARAFPAGRAVAPVVGMRGASPGAEPMVPQLSGSSVAAVAASGGSWPRAWWTPSAILQSRVKRAQEELAAKAPFKRFLQAVTGEQASDSEAEDPDLPIGLANTAYQQRSGIQHSAHGMHSADSIEHQLDLPAGLAGAAAQAQLQMQGTSAQHDAHSMHSGSAQDADLQPKPAANATDGHTAELAAAVALMHAELDGDAELAGGAAGELAAVVKLMHAELDGDTELAGGAAGGLAAAVMPNHAEHDGDATAAAADVGAGDSLPAGCEEAEAAVDEEDEDMDIPKEDADLCNGQVGDDTDDRSSGRSSPNSPICTQPDAPASTPAQPRAARHFLHGRSTGVFFSLHPDGTAGMGVPDEQASGSPYYKGVDQGSSLHAGPPLGADLGEVPDSQPESENAAPDPEVPARWSAPRPGLPQNAVWPPPMAGASETDDDLVDDEVDRAEVAGSAEETPSGLIEEPDSPTDSQEPEQAGQQEGKVGQQAASPSSPGQPPGEPEEMGIEQAEQHAGLSNYNQPPGVTQGMNAAHAIPSNPTGPSRALNGPEGMDEEVAVVKEVAGAAGRAWPDLYDFYEDSEEDMPLVQDENGVIDLTVAA